MPSLHRPDRERICSIKPSFVGLEEQLPLFHQHHSGGAVVPQCSGAGRDVPLCYLSCIKKSPIAWDRNCFFHGGHSDLLCLGGREGWCLSRWPQP